MKKTIIITLSLFICSLAFADKIQNKELSADLTRELNQAKVSSENKDSSNSDLRALVAKHYPAFVKTGAVEKHIGQKLAQDPNWKIKEFSIDKSHDLNWVVFINDERIPLNGPKTSQTFNAELRLEDALDVWNNPKLEEDRKKIAKLSNAVWSYMASFTNYQKDKFRDDWDENSDVYLGLDSITPDRTVFIYIYDVNDVKKYITDEMTSDFYLSPDKARTDSKNRHSDRYFTHKTDDGFVYNTRPVPIKYALKNKTFFMSSGLYAKVWASVALDNFRQFRGLEPLCYDYKPTAKDKFKFLDISGKKYYIKCVPLPKDGGLPIRPYEGSWQVKPKVKTWNLDDF